MTMHAILLVLHIISAVIWLSFLPADMLLRSYILKSHGQPEEKSLINLYLRFANITGIIGMIGILITGIFMVSITPYYRFFDFSANHWLAAKQVIMVFIIIIGGAFMGPAVKDVKTRLNTLQEAGMESDFFRKFNKLSLLFMIMNILVLINFLFAITHRFFG